MHKKKKFIHNRNRYFLNFAYEFYFPIIDDLAVFGKTVYIGTYLQGIPINLYFDIDRNYKNIKFFLLL